MATVSSDAFVNVRLYHGANALTTCVSEPASGEERRKLSHLCSVALMSALARPFEKPDGSDGLSTNCSGSNLERCDGAGAVLAA